MSQHLEMSIRLAAVATLAVAIGVAPFAANGKGVTVLYNFTGGTDGKYTSASVIEDKAGNLYGTTVEHSGGGGTVYKLAPDGTYTVLYAFPSYWNEIFASVISDGAGTLYGTVLDTGEYVDGGRIFKITPAGKEADLYAFAGSGDGSEPEASLIRDKTGNLYGTASQGGGASNCGTVFRLAPDGTFSVLHSFEGGGDGCVPQAGLMMDKAGNLYGTTLQGGENYWGTAFRLAPDGTEAILHSFGGAGDGVEPMAGLIADSAGNLYGTTYAGTQGRNCCGTVFKLMPDGTETILYSFKGDKDGQWPLAGLVRDRAGDLFGTTSSGGKYGMGTVFKLAPDGVETKLHSFDGSDGASPHAGLLSRKRAFYGTTYQGGAYGYGTVFEIDKKDLQQVFLAQRLR